LASSYADYNDLASVRALVNERTAAVMVEAVQGEGGVLPATPEFLGVAGLCDEKNLLLFCDEVQCGMGRTGSWFGFQGYGMAGRRLLAREGARRRVPDRRVRGQWPKVSDVLQPGHARQHVRRQSARVRAALAVHRHHG
jgi:acetylornithine/N-succinyldiaminopimelate aminotransferase